MLFRAIHIDARQERIMRINNLVGRLGSIAQLRFVEDGLARLVNGKLFPSSRTSLSHTGQNRRGPEQHVRGVGALVKRERD